MYARPYTARFARNNSAPSSAIEPSGGPPARASDELAYHRSSLAGDADNTNTRRRHTGIACAVAAIEGGEARGKARYAMATGTTSQ